MSSKANILTELSVVHVMYSGRVTLEGLRDPWREAYTSPDFKRGMNEVVDFSAVTNFDIGFDELLAFAKTSQEIHARYGHKITVCLIAPDKATTGFADMFIDLAQAMQYDNDVMIVQGYPEVFAVLDLSDEEIAQFPEPCQKEAHLL
ncbi:hypothetical protein [Shimia sp. R9_3]|uniref:hypothetical protein n=1 Tax=Shimia sp. R9_3 TaxID=2821113 RepID=UPI001AD9D70D|nr:hypothetical protein [Shimia sp. R9_3]MBO9403003.1 hypothetical protein [Shimia sp. R9_3]